MQSLKSVPDRAAWWLVSVLGVGIGTSLIATWIGSTDGLWVYAPSVIAVLFIILTAPGAVLTRQRLGASPLGRGIAFVILLAYLVLAPVLAATERIVPTLVGIGLLATASVLLTWNALRTRLSIDAVVSAVAFLLVGVGQLLVGVAFLLLGVAFLLFGVAFLRDVGTLVGVAFLLAGVAVLLLGVAFLRYEETLFGVAALLFGVAVLLLGVGILRDGDTNRANVVRRWWTRVTTPDDTRDRPH